MVRSNAKDAVARLSFATIATKDATFVKNSYSSLVPHEEQNEHQCD